MALFLQEEKRTNRFSEYIMMVNGYSANKAEKLEMGFVIKAKGNNQIKKIEMGF